MLSRDGSSSVAQTQRSRLISSARTVIADGGYRKMSVRRITHGAGVSRRTFYDVFCDCEDCFLAVCEDALVIARREMLIGWDAHERWTGKVRGALFRLLALLDSDPRLGRLLMIETLKAGPRVQTRSAEVTAQLSHALHESATCARSSGARGGELPEITGEGIVGGVLGVIQTRLQLRVTSPSRQGEANSMVTLLGELMALIVLPYRGRAAAQRELERPIPIPEDPSAYAIVSYGEPVPRARPDGQAMRVTYRTLLVLSAIAETPGANNRQIADLAGIFDQGQISKLLARLANLGLVENNNVAAGQPSGKPNCWHLTERGRQLQQTADQGELRRALADITDGSDQAAVKQFPKGGLAATVAGSVNHASPSEAGEGGTSR